MRLTKEEFCAAVDKYEKLCKEESLLIEVLGIGPDSVVSKWLEAYYDLLSDMCELAGTFEYGTDLDYYCYELDFGRKWKPGMITFNDKDIPCRNSEELWDLIMMEGD